MNFFFVRTSQEQEAEDLRAVLKLPSGRRLCRRLLAIGNVLEASMGKDRQTTEYSEGMRAVGLWLAGRIEMAAPGEFARLMIESGNDRQANAKPQTRSEDEY